jgi:hypothetical protein
VGTTPQKEEERPSGGGPQTATGTWGRQEEAVQRQTERAVEIGGERMQQATEASAAVAGGALRAGSAVASDAQEITAAWARYAEDVMRYTSEASRALLRARTFAEMLEVQAKIPARQLAVLRRPKRKDSRSGADGDAPVQCGKGCKRRPGSGSALAGHPTCS